MTPLFRPEALQAQAPAWLAPVQLARPLSLTWMTAGVLLALAAVLVFVASAGFTRKATAVGVLVPDRGLIRLVPTAAGTVLEAPVTEGQRVAAGEVLFVLALQQPLLAPGTQGQVQRSLDERGRSLRDTAQQQQRLAAAQQAALQRRLQALDAEAAQLQLEQALQQQRLALAQQALTRQQSLEQQAFVSPAQVQSRQEEVLGLQAAMQTLARQAAALQRDRAEIEGELAALPALAATAVSALARESAVLAREAAELDAPRRLVVRAPQAGTVGAVLAAPGASVSPAAAMATLLPEGAALQAHLYLPSSAIGFVRPGQPVRLRYEAYPYAKFGHGRGEVLQVSRTPLAPSELAGLSLPALPTTALEAGEPLFRVTVALQPSALAEGAERITLVPGLRLHADVLLERRRLLEWMFEPLLGLRQRL
jgi:membrane fusion protein